MEIRMGASADRILHEIKTRGPARTADLAGWLGMTVQGARQQLERLAGESLVEARDEKRGVGRPHRVWSLTELGDARFPDAHSQLTLDLIAVVRREFGEEGLDRLIAGREQDALRAYGARLAGADDLAERVARLAEIRREEGYMAEAMADDAGFVLVENHCPICAAAALCQGFCRSELDTFRRVLGPGCIVERTDHILAGARRCAYRIKPV
jgi:predicted ArsR family transcriptional regulator